MGFLHAIPKPDPRSKRAKAEASTPQYSRIEKMRRAGITPAMPPNPDPRIIAHLLEAGLVHNSGMGPAPLGWDHIRAWRTETDTVVPVWERRLLHRLSAEYLAELNRADSENYPAPWNAPVTQREIETEEARLRMVLG